MLLTKIICSNFLQELYTYSFLQVISTAVNVLKPCNVSLYYRKQCWEVVKNYMIASMNFDDEINLVEKLFNNPR